MKVMGVNIGQTLVRRAVWILGGLLVYAVLGLFTGNAKAGTLYYSTAAEAHAACVAEAQPLGDANSYWQYKDCPVLNYVAGPPESGIYVGRWNQRGYAGTTYCDSYGCNLHKFPLLSACPAGKEWNAATQSCKDTCDANGPALSGQNWFQNNGSTNSVCKDGCGYAKPSSSSISICKTIDGQEWCSATSYTPNSEITCAGDGSSDNLFGVPPPDSDGDGTSDANDAAPNNPGQDGGGLGGPTGEDGSTACGGTGQPVCPPDGTGKGSGNGNTSGGGGDCATPPSSTGDAILGQIAFQTWATRCAIKDSANSVTGPAGAAGAAGAGGAGGAAGPATDLAPTNSLLDAIKSAVAGTKKFFDDLTGEAGTLDQTEGDQGDAGDVWQEAPDPVTLDASGFGWGSSCPAPPVINGVSIDPDGNLCMLVSMLGALILLSAYAQAAYVIGRA